MSVSETKIIEQGSGKERKQSETSDTEYDPQFKPIISLPEVEIITNEENESELLKIRAKLYRYDSISDPPEWKERGTGELKVLRHKENSSMRIVMRRDKTLKVCANHFITPWMELKPSIGSEKAFVYTVLADFADEKPKAECLAVKFGTVDNANLFKTKFEEAKHIVKTECDLYNGKGDKEYENVSLTDDDNDHEEQYDNEEHKIEDHYEKVTKKISELDVTKDEGK